MITPGKENPFGKSFCGTRKQEACSAVMEHTAVYTESICTTSRHEYKQ
jgi:hypothetical protein